MSDEPTANETPASALPSVERSGLPPAEQRRRRRDWRIAALVALLLAVLVALERQVLVLSREAPLGRDAVFLALVHLNVIGIGILVFLCGRNVVKLVVERRRGILGAKLNTKFVASFAFVAVVSTTALFVFSGFLVKRSIDTWFSLEISDSLGQSMEVAEAYYRHSEENALYFARRIAEQVEQRRLLREDALERLRAFVTEKQLEYNLGVVEVFSAQQEELVTAMHPDVAVIAFEEPESELIKAGLDGGERSLVDRAGPGELVRGVVPIRSTFQPADVVGVVVVNTFIPRGISQRIETIASSLSAYRGLQPSQGAFGTSLVLLLAMIALSILLFSSWIGFRLAKQVTSRIQALASATREIAAGNLDVRIDPVGDDEIGFLVSAFNGMATDIARTNEDLERRREQMEVILRGVAAGVISLDADGIVSSINPSAVRLLGLTRGPWVGHKISEVLPAPALEAVEELLRRLAAGSNETQRRQAPLAVGDDVHTLNWTASRLRDPEGGPAGLVLVIDDVTQILAAQRMEAWRDSARRLAHEIKNPLTPIQLSAQRLRRKLGDRVADDESREVLAQCTDAITGQVEALKLLVSEFSNFARLPATDPAPTDLNELVSETVAMYQDSSGIEFHTELDPDVPELDLDREQIKRVILNLVDNAIGAIESTEDGPREVTVSTRADRSVGTVRLDVADTGCGIRASDRRRLFEPYYSTKRNGSGLGLAIVSRIVSDHSGYIRVRENAPRGTRFSVELPGRP